MTSENDTPAPSKAAFKLSMTWYVCPRISSAYMFPVLGLIAICPETYTNPFATVTGVYGPIAAGTLGGYKRSIESAVKEKAIKVNMIATLRVYWDIGKILGGE